MTTPFTREELFQTRAWATLRRPGLAADLTPANFNIFNVNGVIIVSHFYGIVTTLIGAGAATPFPEITTVVPAALVPLSAVIAAGINADVPGTSYGWNGVFNGALTVGAVVGVMDMAAAQTWGGAFVILTAGIINISNATPSTGIIDWYIRYLAFDTATVVTLL